jgi:isopenicillin N synthase-like dioxygenase
MSNPITEAVNKDFVRYDQVEKGHTYRLAESDSDQFDTDYRIQTLDLSRYLKGNGHDRQLFAEELGAAVQDIGFSVLTGHGVENALYNEINERTEELFTTTSIEQKMRFRARRFGSVSQGYFPIKETSGIHPDLVEGWVWCRRAFQMPQDQTTEFHPEEFWPDTRYEPIFRKLTIAHEKLFQPIAQAMFQGLGCDPHVYDRRLTNTNFGLRLNYYPPLRQIDNTIGAGRLLGHEDVDLFTILPASKVGGLQVWNHRSQKWVRLDAPEGSIIINTGDYMQRITNDRLPSTSHRVGMPLDGSQHDTARISFPIAVYVREEEVLDVLPGLGKPKYDPIKAITFHTRSTSKFYGDDYAVESPLEKS